MGNDFTPTLLNKMVNHKLKIFLPITFFLALLSCNENEKITNSEENISYSISGSIHTNSYNENVNGLLVSIEGVELIETATDSSGHFYVEDIKEGNYRIKIWDSSEIRIDTAISIQSDITLQFTLNELLSDYLPIKINSQLIYKFTNYPYGGAEYQYFQEGTLTWEIIDADEDKKLYEVREILEGSWGEKYPGHLDSPHFGPDTNVTEFQVVNDLWLEVKLSFLEINHNKNTIEIKKYYPDNWGEEITISNQEWWIDYDPKSYINSEDNFHRIRLREDFGIVYWYCGGISNGSKLFILELKE